MYNFSSFKTKLAEVHEWLGREYLGIRTGKATPAVLDSVMVESYGTKTPLKHVAAISIEDARTVRITPWDRNQLGAIQSAIEASNTGLSLSPDSTGLRAIFPMLTEERRKMLIKLTNEKLEDARISVRKEREKIWEDIQEQEKAGEMSEDDKYKGKEELQKLVDEANNKLEELAKKKEVEIMS
ncbi:MAG TPA: ribosome recycling factor [Candidatus Paceibacterota bacterium]|nr:ribosome recycling factor [Candidatus Paceibacterota bacterium]